MSGARPDTNRPPTSCFRRLIGEDIDLATRLDPALEPVRVDPGLLAQAVINVAVNAHDAIPQGGKLTIETRNAHLDEPYAREHPDAQPGPYALLMVSDTGHGKVREVLDPPSGSGMVTTRESR